MLVTFDPPAEMGGIEGRLAAYTRGIIRSGNRVEITSFGRSSQRHTGTFEGTRITFVPSSLLRVILHPRYFATLVSRVGVDGLFLLTGGGTTVGALILLYARACRIPTGVFFYGRDLLQSRKNPLVRLTAAVSILVASRLTTNSIYTANLLRQISVRRAVILYPGVDTSLLRTADADRTRDSHPRILFVGRLVRRKGVDLLLKAFVSVKTLMPEAILEVVGDGPEMGRLVRSSETLGVRNSVIFHGALRGEPLWRQYSESDLFVMPARSTGDDVEGFGTVFIEAGLFGKPVVATRSGGIPEAVIDGMTGLLVEENDPTGLGQAIVSLLSNDEERRRLGRNAQLRVVSHFSWENATSKLLRLFEEV